MWGPTGTAHGHVLIARRGPALPATGSTLHTHLQGTPSWCPTTSPASPVTWASRHPALQSRCFGSVLPRPLHSTRGFSSDLFFLRQRQSGVRFSVWKRHFVISRNSFLFKSAQQCERSCSSIPSKQALHSGSGRLRGACSQPGQTALLQGLGCPVGQGLDCGLSTSLGNHSQGVERSRTKGAGMVSPRNLES